VNELTNLIPKDGRSLSDLLATNELDPGEWRVRRAGGTIVLEWIGEPEGIPPGSYTKDTLPPLSEGARKILATIDAVAPLKDARSQSKIAGALAEEDDLIEIDDAGVAIELSDEPLPGIDPDR